MSRPSTAPQRVVLHVGLYKTGTSYLQNLMRHNRRRLANRAGVYVPPGPRKTVLASLDLIPRHAGRARDVRVAGAWQRLADEVNGCGLRAAVVSEERLSVANARQAQRAVSSFPGADVHVVVTVRDLARVTVSHWQEEVKNGAVWTLDEYLDFLQDPQAAGTKPARGFWLHEDVTGVLRTWASVVPFENVHVVTVPPPGSPPDLLTRRFGSVVGFTPDDVPRQDFWNNENIGVVGAELVRRLNQRLDGHLEGIPYEYGVKRPLMRRLAARPDRRTPVLDDAQRAWAAKVSAGYADEIRRAGYRVVGDLDDLQPPPADTPVEPDNTAPEDALLDAALESLAELSARYGEAMAKVDQAEAAQRPQVAGRLPQLRANLRSRGYAVVRNAADAAGRTSLGRRASAAYIRRRAGR